MALRKVEVTVPIEREFEICMLLQDSCCIRSLVAVNGAGTTIFQFVCRAERLEKILNKLALHGCGTTYGMVLVLPVNVIRPLPARAPEDRSTTRERLPIEEVYDRVMEMCKPGFNWFVFIFVAGCVASLGLIFDSTATVVSAMLLSPLMDPLIGMIFGFVIRDKTMFFRATGFFCLGSFLVLFVGFVFGLIFSNWSDDLDWPTPEMETRANSRALISGSMISFVSGIAAGLCVTNGGINSLVGVAIAASILPPIANGGICLARAALGPVVSDKDDVEEYLIMCAYTLGLFFINVLNIFIAALIMFKVKSVVPATTNKQQTFYRDIPKIALVRNEDRPWSDTEASRWSGVKRRGSFDTRETLETTRRSRESTYNLHDESHCSTCCPTCNIPQSKGHTQSRSSFHQHPPSYRYLSQPTLTEDRRRNQQTGSQSLETVIDAETSFFTVLPQGYLPIITPPTGQKWLFEEPRHSWEPPTQFNSTSSSSSRSEDEEDKEKEDKEDEVSSLQASPPQTRASPKLKASPSPKLRASSSPKSRRSQEEHPKKKEEDP